MQIRDLDASQFARLSALLDEALGLAPAEREAWLAGITRRDDASGELLQRVLSSHANGTDPWLETRSALDRHLASLPREEQALAGKRLGPYRVVSLLGHGGMGSVWLAERADGLFHRRVAVKLLHPALIGRGVSERFAREREILAGLEHPNIARLLEAGIADDGQPYLALQYVQGVPITDYCDQHRLGIRERLQLFLQVLGAVQYAHAHLVIHRDLKPSNILVTEEGDVQLLDFGIAKLLTAEAAVRETELTQLGGRVLTPEYAAPEQVTGAPITTVADVYALGVILYELLTGQRPYRLKRESRGALEDAILQGEPVPPSRSDLTDAAARARSSTVRKLAHALSGDLDTIALKTLKKQPVERYPTAEALQRDIERHVTGQAVLARADSLWYRARKFLGRNRLAVTAAAVVVAALVGGLGVALWQARVAHFEARNARERELQVRRLSAIAEEQAADAAADLGDLNGSLARLAYAARLDPDNAGIRADLLFRLRRQGFWWLPLGQPMRHGDQVNSVAFDAAGARVVTASDDHTARIWNARTGASLAGEMRHADAVNSARFNPDGTRIVTASSDHTARIWDAGTGQPRSAPLQHGDTVFGAQFSADGTRVLTASRDGTARLWDARSGTPLGAPMRHAGRVLDAEFSHAGRRVVTASDDGTARVWDAYTGVALGPPMHHGGRVLGALFTADESLIVTTSDDHTARIWDALTGRPIGAPLRHGDQIDALDVSPDGSLLITGSEDRTARVWDVRTGRPLGAPLGHADIVYDVSFSSDGARVASASRDHSARVWNARTGEALGPPLRHDDSVYGARFSPDGARIATASFDHTARLWTASAGAPFPAPMRHAAAVYRAVFSPDGASLVTASADHTARIWDARSATPIGVPMAHEAEVTRAAFSPDGTRIATTSHDKTARIWDARTGRPLGAPIRFADEVTQAEFSPDGTRVLVASWDRTARLCDAATGQPLAAPLRHEGRIIDAAFSADGGRVVTVSDDRTARVWQVPGGAPAYPPLQHAGRVTYAEFSADGRLVVSASADHTARIWNARTGAVLITLRHDDAVARAHFSADGTRVVTASSDRTARIWEVRTGHALGAPMRLDDVVFDARFSSDGTRIVTASADHTARVWDGWTGQPLGPPLRHDDRTYGAEFSADGKWIVTASADQTARVWPVLSATAEEVTRLIDFTEAIVGYGVDAHNAVVPLADRDAILARLRARAAAQLPAPKTDLELLMRDFLAPAADPRH